MKPRRLYVDGPFGQVHVQTLGEGPAIVLNHQSGSSSGAFEPIYPRIAAAGFRAVGVDAPGMGNSDGPEAECWSLGMFADAVAAVVSSLNLGKVMVAGHHTGAGTALRFANLYPDHVRGIVVHGPLIYDAETRARFLANPIPPIIPQADGSHLLRAWTSRELAAPGGWTLVEPMHRGVLDLLRAGPRVVRSFTAAFEHECEEDLRNIRQPGMILTNSGDNNHIRSQQAHAIRPDFRYVELTGGALDIMDEQPDAWANAVIEFVRSICTGSQ